MKLSRRDMNYLKTYIQGFWKNHCGQICGEMCRLYPCEIFELIAVVDQKLEEPDE